MNKNRTVGEAEALGVARKVVVELEGGHSALDDDVGPRRRHVDGARTSSLCQTCTSSFTSSAWIIIAFFVNLSTKTG